MDYEATPDPPEAWALSDDEIERLFTKLPSSRRSKLVEQEIRENLHTGFLAANLLRAIGHDRATSIIQRQQREANGGSLPPLDLAVVTAAQCSVFDNWGSEPPVKNAGAHYKATIEVWNVPTGVRLATGKNSFWTAHAGLFTTNELEEVITKLAKGRGMTRPWSAADADDQRGADFERYGQALLATSRANPTLRIGPAMVTKGKERYPLFTFAAADAQALADRKNVTVSLYTSSAMVEFSRFDTALPGPVKFGSSNQILHSRGSKRAEDSGWRTFVLP